MVAPAGASIASPDWPNNPAVQKQGPPFTSPEEAKLDRTLGRPSALSPSRHPPPTPKLSVISPLNGLQPIRQDHVGHFAAQGHQTVF